MSEFSRIYELSIGRVFERQLRCGEVFGDAAWNVDLREGTLSFAATETREELTIPIQVLGSESNVSNTWLWAWAQPPGRMPDAILKAVNALRKYGLAQKIEELTIDQFALSESLDGHRLASVASAVLPCHGYYRCPHPQGALFVALMSPIAAPPRSSLTLRYSVMVPQILAAGLPIENIPEVCAAYARDLGLKVRMNFTSGGTANRKVDEAKSIEVFEVEPGSKVTVHFDDLKRVKKIDADLRPNPTVRA